MSVRTFTGQPANIPAQRTNVPGNAKTLGSREQRRAEARKAKNGEPIRCTLDTMRPLIRGVLLALAIALCLSAIATAVQ